MKHPPRTILLVLLSMAVGLFGGDQSAGFSYYVSNGVAVVWAAGGSVRDLSPTTFPPGSVTEELVLGAMGLWNLVPACPFEYSYFPLDQDYPIDHFDGFNDTVAVPASALDPGVLAVTYLVNDGPNWFDMDILFHENPEGVGYSFETNPDCAIVNNPKPVNGYSFLLIATHELGHALGLGHDPIGNEAPGTPWFIANMNPSYPGAGPVGQQNIVELHTDDRNGARFLYPPSGPAEPPMVDLAIANQTSSSTLGKTAPITFSPAVIYPGEEVLARSVIENFGTSSELYVRQGFYLSTDSLIETTDFYLGGLRWDIAFGQAFEFDAFVTLPGDLPAGDYYLGSILDDLDEIAEEYEDNNAALYCQPLTVAQRPPAINPPGPQTIPCDGSFVSAAQSVTLPLNMGPITWSLENAPAGMIIHPSTGVISWTSPVHSPFPYVIDVRATNDAGTTTAPFLLGVSATTPVLVGIADHIASCRPEYVGPAPVVSQPRCMEPVLTWLLVDAPHDMTIDPTTGRVTWPSPIPSNTPYNVIVAAINAAGTGIVSWQLHVNAGDVDGNDVIDEIDLLYFLDCIVGPEGSTDAGCSCADADRDGDIDLADFGSFQSAFGR